MADFMSSQHYHPIHDDEPSHIDMSHLSGMTLSNFVTKEPNPKIHLIDASPSNSYSKSPRSSVMANSRRSSTYSTSTTKSQLRHTNQLLIGMLQNIQTELETHRTIMLDIQHRVSHLEYESEASVNGNNDTHLSALRSLEGRQNTSQRSSRLVVPEEGISWWQACQNFASNAEPPISAAEFLRTPKRASGFTFDWSLGPSKARSQSSQQQQDVLSTPPATPPEVDDLPPLTPTSEESENSDLDTPVRHDMFVGEDMLSSTPKLGSVQGERSDEIVEDIRGQEVEVDKRKMPAPPLLQPAPVKKPVSVRSAEKELPQIPVEPQPAVNPHRYYKGVKSLSTYKALFKNKATEKEHQVLIHFHRRADIAHLKTEEE